MKDTKFSAAQLAAAGLKLNYCDDDMFLIEDGQLRRHMIGDYDAATLGEVLRDIEQVQLAIVEGRLGNLRKRRTFVDIDTSKYYKKHRATPHGIRGWIFQVGDETFGHYGDYANATAAARIHALELGITQIEVLP